MQRRLKVESTLYDDSEVIKRFAGQDTQFQVVQGKIAAIISDSEIGEYQSGGITMNSRLASVQLSLQGLSAQFSEMHTEYDAMSGNFTSLSSKVNQIEVDVNGLNANIASVEATALETSTQLTQLSATVNGVSSRVSSVQTTLEQDYATIVYADNKASAAQSSAISAAAQDATTKASQALSDAKDDATTKANNAISTAAQDATDKANAAKKDATDYTDEKLKSYVTSLEYSEFKQTVQGFEQNVGKTYATITYADNKVTDALSTASDDATTKANRALSDAKADATSKANSALSDAKGYTDDTASNILVYGVTSKKESSGKVTITATVRQGGTDKTSAYPSSWFSWERKTEDGNTNIGSGRSITVDPTDFDYGGAVIGRFQTFEEGLLKMPDGKYVKFPNNKRLLMYHGGTGIYEQEVNVYNPDIIESTIAQLNSAIRQSAESIELEVSKKIGSDEARALITETAEGITQEVSQNYVSNTTFDSEKDDILDTASNDATAKANAARTGANADTDNKLKSYSTTVQMQSAIDQKADSITSSVSKTYATITYADNKASSALSDGKSYTDNKLKSYSTTVQMQSAITQESNSIKASVSETYATKNALASANSAIEQNANNIALKVSTSDYTGAKVASLINQSADTVLIAAKHLDLKGYVTVTDLSTSGKTIINGANITTGKVASENGKVYFDLDNNEIACSRLVAPYSTRYPAATLDFGQGEYSGGGYISYLRIYNDGHLSDGITLKPITDNYNLIESTSGLRVVGGTNMYLSINDNSTVSNLKTISLNAGSGHVDVTSDGAIHLTSASGKYVYLGGRVMMTLAQMTTDSSATHLGINTSGRIVQTSSSSRRYKHAIANVKNNDLTPSRLYDIPVRQYVFNNDYLSNEDARYGKTVIGLIAEEVAEHYPIAVIRDANGDIKDWQERYIVPAMLALIQEQNERIKKMEEILS